MKYVFESTFISPYSYFERTEEKETKKLWTIHLIIWLLGQVKDFISKGFETNCVFLVFNKYGCICILSNLLLFLFWKKLNYLTSLLENIWQSQGLFIFERHWGNLEENIQYSGGVFNNKHWNYILRRSVCTIFMFISSYSLSTLKVLLYVLRQ